MYSDGVLAEMWFTSSCEQLGLLDKNPLRLSVIKRILNKHLNYKVRQALPFLKDRNDPQELLDKVMKTDCLLWLEDINGHFLRVAVDVTANSEEVEEKLSEISLPSFFRVRKELGIDKHWVVFVKALELSSRFSLIDALYSQTDDKAECAILVID